MTGKRQHCLPVFLQRRFAVDPDAKVPRLFRLDLRPGRPEKVNARNEAMVNRYYRMVAEDDETNDLADEVLDRIESGAAPAIASLAEHGLALRRKHIEVLALLIATLKVRTPEGRGQLREMDRRFDEMQIELQLSDVESVRERMSDSGWDQAELDDERERLLGQLRRGELIVESTPSREVALMFMATEETTKALLSELGWTLVRAPAERSFVLSDHPVSHYDPTPKVEGAGASYLSSEHAYTLIPLDPSFALLLEPLPGGGWREVDADAKDVDELNMLTYAWANNTIYGNSQEAIARVRRNARRKRSTLARFAKRPPRIWVADVGSEGEEGEGVKQVTSTYRGSTLRRDLYVSPDAAKSARKNAFRASGG